MPDYTMGLEDVLDRVDVALEAAGRLGDDEAATASHELCEMVMSCVRLVIGTEPAPGEAPRSLHGGARSQPGSSRGLAA